MRIFIDLTSIYDKLSGIEKFTLNIAKNMLQNDTTDQYILAFKKEVHKDFNFIKTLNNVEYVIFNTESKLKLSQVDLPRYLKKNKCDVYLFLAFPAPLLFSNRRVVSAVHDLTPWLYPETMSKKGLIYFRTLIKNAIKRNKLIITVSENSKKDIKKQFNHNNVEVIYNGVDSNYRVYSRDDANKVYSKYNLPHKYILCLGTLEPRKNIKLLIDAFIDLKINKKIDHKLVITGRYGWKYDSILDMVKANNLEKEIIFTGFVEEEDLPLVYNGSDLFVFPSMYEGFGIPPLEAMACGVPVIVSNSSSLTEVVGEYGIVFENNNLDDLKSKIIRYINLDDKSKDEYRKYCINRSNKFRWKRESIKLINILHDNFKGD